MKSKKFILIAICCLVFLGIIFLSRSKNEEISQKRETLIFVGKILEVEKTEDNTRLLVQGYIKGCEVYEETLVALVNEKTEILGICNNEKIKDFSIGDRVYIELSEAFTKSIPPQSVAKKIQVSKIK